MEVSKKLGFEESRRYVGRKKTELLKNTRLS